MTSRSAQKTEPEKCEPLAVLADFAAGVSLQRLPRLVVLQARLTLLDTLGCILAGAGEPEAKQFLQAEQGRGGAAESLVMGTNLRLSAEAACRVNAYQGDIFELNDLTGGHAGIAIVPLALALGEAAGASGKAVLEAIVAGVEVTSRVYAAYYPHIKPFTETGMAPPGLPSAFGAAAAAARLLELNAAQTRQALAIAGAIASWCPAEVIFGDGGTIKPTLFGAWPGTAGIMAARYAAAGLSGPPRILDSGIGYFATVAHRFDTAALGDGIWHLAAPRRKLHACCGYIHSALDSVIALRNEGVDIAAAQEIRVRMPAYILPVISKPAPPATPNEARFNAEYMLAIAAHGVDAVVPAHSIGCQEWLSRPEVSALMSRIRISADPALAHYHHSVIEILQADGSLLARRNLAPRGAPANPMDDGAMRAKFSSLVTPVLGQARAEAVVGLVDELETAANLQPMLRAVEETIWI